MNMKQTIQMVSNKVRFSKAKCQACGAPISRGELCPDCEEGLKNGEIIKEVGK